MIVLIGVLAHSALFRLADPESAGVAWAVTLACAGIAVGTLASESSYATWYQKSLWLLALLAAVIVLPDHLDAARGLLSTLPERLRDIWLAVAILPTPVGILVGSLKVWTKR